MYGNPPIYWAFLIWMRTNVLHAHLEAHAVAPASALLAFWRLVEVSMLPLVRRGPSGSLLGAADGAFLEVGGLGFRRFPWLPARPCGRSPPAGGPCRARPPLAYRKAVLNRSMATMRRNEV
jgi:hypothetical protein